MSAEPIANKIIDGLWLGGAIAQHNPEFLRKNKINVIVNCTKDVEMPFRNIEYFQVPVNDTLKDRDYEEMIMYLPHVVDFIHKKRDIEGKNILVACMVGKQRSACVVTTYLSLHHNMTIRDAVDHILKKRPVAFHNGKNINFLPSLLYYSQTNVKKTNVSRKTPTRKTPVRRTPSPKKKTQNK